MTTLREYRRGYYATVFPDFEAAVRHHAILFTHFGFEDPVEEAVRWAISNDYRPDGYTPKRYDGSKIEDLKANNRIEDVANRLTDMRWFGDRGRGPCPLHGGSNRSAFTVYLETQSFYCFNCNAGGDVIDLAEKAGIEL